MDDTSLLDVVVRDGLVLQQELPLVDKPLLVRVNAQEPVDLHLQTLHAVLLLDLQPKVLSNHSLDRNLHLKFKQLIDPFVATVQRLLNLFDRISIIIIERFLDLLNNYVYFTFMDLLCVNLFRSVLHHVKAKALWTYLLL